MDLLRFIFGSFAFVIESAMGCMTSIIMILFLMCALGALVECPKMF